MANVFEKAVTSAVMNQMNVLLSKVAQEAKRNAPNTKGDRISRAISVIPARSKDGIVYGSIIVDLNIAPEARAYEYGSGIHGKTGEKYPIAPKNAPMMIFWWKPPMGDITGGSLPWLFTIDGSEGLIGFRYPISHPGVEAKPYLRPALIKHLESIRGRLLNTLKVEIGFGFKEPESTE